MALRGIYGYRHPDQSLDYNSRTARIIDRAILDGGALSYTGTLLVNIDPFIAHSYDGMVVLSSEREQVTLVDNQINYIVCFAQYQTSAAPIIDIRVIQEIEWLTSVNRNFFITFAKFDLQTNRPNGGYALVNASNADYSVSDYSDKLGRNSFRNAVASASALPTVQNRKGDVRVAQDTLLTYTWTGTAWQALKTQASAVTSTAYGSVNATNVQAAIEQLADLFTAASFANNITFTPAGNIAASNVQAAIQELDTEKVGAGTANTFTANQTISAADADSSKLVLENTAASVGTYWSKILECRHDLNRLRLNLAGSADFDHKRFQFVMNANFNTSTGQYTADNPGSAIGQAASMLRYDQPNHTFSFGLKADTSSSWNDTGWIRTDLILPKTVNLALTVQTDGTITAQTSLSDRVVYSCIAHSIPAKFYVSFPRKFTSTPTVTLSAAGSAEQNVATASVSEVTTKGFLLTITPTTQSTGASPQILTVDRTWTAS